MCEFSPDFFSEEHTQAASYKEGGPCEINQQDARIRLHRVLARIVILQPLRLDKRHHIAQFRAHLLDKVRPLTLALGEEVLATILAVLGDPLLGEAAVLDLLEHLVHLALGLLGDQTLTA